MFKTMDILSQFADDLMIEEADVNGTHFVVIRFRDSATPALYHAVQNELIILSLEYPTMTVKSTPYEMKRETRIRRKFRGEHNREMANQKRRNGHIHSIYNELAELGYTMEELADETNQYQVPDDWQVVLSETPIMNTAKCVASWPLQV